MGTNPREALAEIREVLLDPGSLVRATASGRQRGSAPRWRRLDLRPVRLKAGPRLQLTAYDETQAFTSNHAWSDAASVVDPLLEEPFATWRVEGTTGSWHVEITGDRTARVRRGEAVAAADQAHDRSKQRLLDPAEPYLHAIGITDGQGHVKPSRRDKLAQVEQFLRLLDDALRPLLAHRDPAAGPLRVADLGCGNAYLTFATVAWLDRIGIDARTVGIDVKPAALERNSRIAADLGWDDRLSFGSGAIDEWAAGEINDHRGVDVVLALHACDTATDDALAVAVRAGASLILAAPCCHHDIQRQLASAPSGPLLRHGILRERLGDVITDGLRAHLLRLLGYRVEVIEFVASEHTPRNTMIRAHLTGAAPTAELWREYDATIAQWRVTPRLATALRAELDARR